ncbi:MAG TPA: transposase, partial [Acidiferrobacteraceae bacterium]|nr:transposase [Acidiferrobacteraceae bacterium]
MKNGLILLLHLLTLLIRLTRPGGAKAIVTENLALKHQLLIAQRRHHRSPNLTVLDRYLLGWSAMLMSPRRVLRCAIVVKPTTILAFHRALVTRKYRLLFGAKRKTTPGPKGPSQALIEAIVEIKQRNPRFGCPRIAMTIVNTFGIEIDKGVVRRVLAAHYTPDPDKGTGLSWLSFIGHTKDSLWSIDFFCCESITLQTHWVLLVMDQWSRRIIGFAVHQGPVDGPALCGMFNQIIVGTDPPKRISSDHDP